MTGAPRRDMVPWLFLATCLTFWPTLVALPGHWNSYNEHGFVIAGLVLWLMWRDRHRLRAAAGEPELDLLPLLGIGSLVWLSARVIDIDSAHHTLFYVLVLGWVIAVFGRSSGRVAVPIALTVLIAAPFGEVIVPALQRVAVIVTGAITTLGGIDAEIGAYTIGISTGTFVVEAGCSGLNYLMVSLTLGAVYAHLFVRERGLQLRVMAVAAGTALLSNWIRIGALVFVGEATEMQSSLITDHLAFGWVVFTAMLVPAYLMVRRIERRAAPTAGHFALDLTSSNVARTDVAGTDVAGTILGPEDEVGDSGTVAEQPPTTRLPGMGRPRAARLATAATVVGPVLYMVVGLIPRSTVMDRSTDVFRMAPVVTLQPRSEPAWTPDFQGIDARADWIATTPDATLEIAASRFWFLDQRQGEELIQGLNSIAPDSLTVSSQYVGAGAGTSRIVQETVLFTPDGPRIAWSWYRVAGHETPFRLRAKLFELWAWLTRAEPSELVTVSAACEPDSCEGAAMALRDAVSAAGR